MFRASSLLLITIILNTLLGSSTPRPVNVVLYSEEAGSEELARVSEDHEILGANKHSPQEELIPAAAGEAGASPEEPALDEDNAGTVKPPEYPMPDGTKGAGSQVADTVGPLTSHQQEVTEVDAASDETAAAEISPGGTPGEIDPTGALEGIPAEDGPQVSAIPLEASEDTDTDASTETEEDSLGLNLEEGELIVVTAAGPETEGTSPEDAASEQRPSQQPVVDVPVLLTDTVEDQEEASPVLLPKTDGGEENIEPASQSVENAEVARTEEQAPPSVLANDESDISVAVEGQVEPADDEMAAKEVAVHSDDSVEEPELEETIPKVSADDADQEASEEHAAVDTEENAEKNSPESTITLGEDETVAVVSDSAEESQEDPAAVALSTSEEELEETAQEEAILPVSPGPAHQEGSERTEIETEGSPIPNSPNDGGSSEVDEALVFTSDADENIQEGPVAVVAPSPPVEEQEEVREEMVPTVSPRALHQEPSKETEVETKVTTTANVVPAAPEEDQTQALTFDLNEESHKKAVPATATEEPPVSLRQEPVPEDPVLIIVLEERGEDYEGVREETEEEAASPSTAALGDSGLDELVASGTATTQEVPEPALVNRGAVLGAALFTLVSFIMMGFIWTTVAKKLR